MSIHSDREKQKRLIRRIFMRIIPVVFVLYVVSYLNRANIGYAALQMNAELALHAEAFGFAAGVFFVGFFFFEVPKNMLFPKYGARLCLSLILLTWGIAAVWNGFVENATQLYIARFFVGATEAGFFPGVIYYLSCWFRKEERATSVALFAAAIPVSYICGAPLSMAIMEHISWLGLSGWRWMTILEGAPALIGGIFVFFFMADRPEDARWLSEEERNWYAKELAAERGSQGSTNPLEMLKAIVNSKVLFLAAIYFVYQAGSLAIGYWMPSIVKETTEGLSVTMVGFVVAIPFIFATAGMIYWSRRSDKHAERKMHAALPLLFSGIALACIGFNPSPVISLLLISAALTGFYAFKAPFWALPGLFLSRAEAAVSIAAINSIGNLGGFAGPYVIGYVKRVTGHPMMGLAVLSVLVFIAFAMTYCMRIHGTGQTATTAKQGTS